LSLKTMMDPGLRPAGMTRRGWVFLLPFAMPFAFWRTGGSLGARAGGRVHSASVQLIAPAFVTAFIRWKEPSSSAQGHFVFGAVVPGSTLTINGGTVPSILKRIPGDAPLSSGDVLLKLDAVAPGGKRLISTGGFPSRRVDDGSADSNNDHQDTVSPADDSLLAPGDTLRVAFQGSPEGHADFAIEGIGPISRWWSLATHLEGFTKAATSSSPVIMPNKPTLSSP